MSGPARGAAYAAGHGPFHNPPTRCCCSRPGEVNPKAPCPCGSGRRYKHCHGSGYAPPVRRPFEGLTGEPDWVAMRELVPAATATLRTTDGRDGDAGQRAARRHPRAGPGQRRDPARPAAATSSDDVSRDLGTALAAALQAPQGAPVDPGPIGGAGSAGPRLQELLDLDAPFEVTVHDDFGFWLEGAAVEPAAQAGLQHANEMVMPTVRLAGLEAAYWCRPSTDRAHVRWARPEPEEPLLDALARLSAAEQLTLGEGTRYAGAFRAHGLVVPVWDVPAETPGEDWAGPAAGLQSRLESALPGHDPLTADERRARAGLLSRRSPCAEEERAVERRRPTVGPEAGLREDAGGPRARRHGRHAPAGAAATSAGCWAWTWAPRPRSPGSALVLAVVYRLGLLAAAPAGRRWPVLRTVSLFAGCASCSTSPPAACSPTAWGCSACTWCSTWC